MKLSANIPLDVKKEQALLEVDAAAVQKLAMRSTMAMVYATKSALANRVLDRADEPPQWLIQEASSKNMTVADLCQLILEKAAQAEQENLLFESLRQTCKANIRHATSEQQIRSSKLSFTGN